LRSGAPCEIRSLRRRNRVPMVLQRRDHLARPTDGRFLPQGFFVVIVLIGLLAVVEVVILRLKWVWQ
jgi:hypothetical protein